MLYHYIFFRNFPIYVMLKEYSHYFFSGIPLIFIFRTNISVIVLLRYKKNFNNFKVLNG